MLIKSAFIADSVNSFIFVIKKNTAPMIVISRERSLQTISPSVSLCPSNMTDSSLSATYFDSGTQICTFHRDFDARTHTLLHSPPPRRMLYIWGLCSEPLFLRNCCSSIHFLAGFWFLQRVASFVHSWFINTRHMWLITPVSGQKLQLDLSHF